MKRPVLRAFLLPIGAALLTFTVAFFSTFRWMEERWGGVDSYYGHGFLVPFVFAYLLYRKRRDWLPELSRDHPPSRLLGGSLLAAALLLHFVGKLLTVFFLSGLALWLALCAAGLILFNLRGFASVRIPFLFLLFMIPLPIEFLEFLSVPLKTAVGHAGITLAGLAGVPAILNGFEVTLSSGPVLIGNPCSGLRSLVALAALGALTAHLSPLNRWGKVLLFLVTVPAALLANTLRVTFLLLFAHHYGIPRIAPGTPAHDYSGYLLFAFAFVLLMVSAQGLEKWQTAKS